MTVAHADRAPDLLAAMKICAQVIAINTGLSRPATRLWFPLLAAEKCRRKMKVIVDAFEHLDPRNKTATNVSQLLIPFEAWREALYRALQVLQGAISGTNRNKVVVVGHCWAW